MCAVMIDCTPASIAARNGSSATSSSSSTTGSARCESTDVSPCPGKCFAHAATPAPCSPRTNAATCLRDERAVGAERADPDHRVLGVRVDVRDRREVEVDADRRRARLRASAATRSRQLHVVDDAERGVARIRAAGPRLEPRDVAALLVDRDEQVRLAPSAGRPSAREAARGSRRSRRRGRRRRALRRRGGEPSRGRSDPRSPGR